MATSRTVVSATLVMLTAAMTATSQQPPGAATRVKATQRATEATVQSQAATEVVAAPAAVAVRLGQQRRQSFERTRVLAGTTGTITLQPDAHAQCTNGMAQHRSDGALQLRFIALSR